MAGERAVATLFGQPFRFNGGGDRRFPRIRRDEPVAGRPRRWVVSDRAARGSRGTETVIACTKDEAIAKSRFARSEDPWAEPWGKG